MDMSKDVDLGADLGNLSRSPWPGELQHGPEPSDQCEGSLKDYWTHEDELHIALVNCDS